MDLLVLCGGQATRLGGLAAARPKVLMDVNGRPFLEHLLGFYEAHVDRVLLLAGHLGDQLASYRSARVEVAVEAAPLDTGGAVLSILDRVSATFAVANGDTLFAGLDVASFLGEAARAPATAVVTRGRTAGRGCVEVEGRGAVCFQEKQGPDEGFVYAGLVVLGRGALSDFPRARSSLERAILPRLAEQGRLEVWPFAGRIFDIGTPAGLDSFRTYDRERGCP